MTNRTEMLHFRATPEEKARIKENAGHAEVALSTWMRERSLDVDKPYEGSKPPESFKAVNAEALPTQPAVEASERIHEEAEAAKQGFTASFHRDPETYEQFMERRVPELCGENPSVAEIGDAEIAARAEWAER